MVVVHLPEIEESIIVIWTLAEDLTIDLDCVYPVLSEEVDITSQDQKVRVIWCDLQCLVDESNSLLVATLCLIDGYHRAKVDGRLGEESRPSLQDREGTDGILLSKMRLSYKLIDLVLIRCHITIKLTEANYFGIEMSCVG